MKKEIRWKQRYQNFEKALSFLSTAVTKENLSEIEKAGMVQIFEFTFELSWKTLKDFLEEKSVEVNFPRDIIKTAFEYNLIDDGDVWMDMLDKRNLMSHTYNETYAQLACNLIVNEYFKQLQNLAIKLKVELLKDE